MKRKKHGKRSGHQKNLLKLIKRNTVFFLSCMMAALCLSKIPSKGYSAGLFQRQEVSTDALVEHIENVLEQTENESVPKSAEESTFSEIAENVWNTAIPEKREKAVDLPVVTRTSASEVLSGLPGRDFGQYVRNSELDNGTDYELDLPSAAREELPFSSSSPRVLIIHTHGSECYEPDDGDRYVQTDPWRTTDCGYNVIHIGDIVTEELEAKGIQVLHDRNLYDYPGYNGSYSRSMEAIEAHLAQYPDIEIVLDIHRDANESGYSTVKTIEGKSSAQVMLIVGTDFAGLEHPAWQKNFQWAAHIQGAMNALYPGLARELCISQYRYNQQATVGSLIAEIGYNCNRLSEAENAARFFANSVYAALQA